MRRVLPLVTLASLLLPAIAAALVTDHPASAPADPRLRERSLPLLSAPPSAAAKARVRGEKAPASLRAIVLLCEFEDQVFYGREPAGTPVDPVHEEIHYAARDFVYYDHHLTDVNQYYATVSGGDFALDYVLHAEFVALPRTMDWYGDHPEFGEQPVILARDVVAAVDDAVDFGGYDTVLLIHAGPGEETDVNGDSPEQIYSTYLDPESFADAVEDSLIDDPWLEADDGATRLDQVLVLPETAFQDSRKFGSLGIYCFSVGQRLGMLSLGVGYRSWGIGSLGLMGWGLYAANGWNPPHPCPLNKQLMGWIEPVVVRAGSVAESLLTPAEDPTLATACVRLEAGGGEYWLLEYRRQDPDGNRRWSFGDDLNRNGRRDYVNVSSPDSLPVPGEKFDPAEDTREWLVDAEWDFHMTFNGDRPPEEDTGRGSGVYVWHVDEKVIRDALDSGFGFVNWDPARKGVDVEEADGIQDMDSYEADIAYGFGHEDDAYRDSTQVFGPTTRPGTATNTGARTGILVGGFSPVLLGEGDPEGPPAPDGGPPYVYADEVTFDVEIVTGEAGPPAALERELPVGTDPRGSHVLIADLDAGDTTPDEIVLAGRRGEVFVLDGGLDERLDHDGVPSTLDPFAVGTWGGEPVPWNLPPAAGNLDGDAGGDLEIVLTGPRGVYAFRGDGTPLRPTPPDSNGLYVALAACDLPPVLVPADAAADDPDDPVHVAVVAREGDTTWLRTYAGVTPAEQLAFDLGDVVVRATPVLAFGRLWVAAADTAAGAHRLLACDLDPAASAPVREYGLELEPGALPPAWGYEAGAPDERRRWLAIFDRTGRGETVTLDEDLARVGANRVWPADRAAFSNLAAGAYVGSGRFHRVGPQGDWMDGWPRHPRPAFALTDSTPPAGPLVFGLAGAVRIDEQILFPAPDGRIFVHGPRGESEAGWPVAGPGPAAGTPALGSLTGETRLDLVAVGSSARIAGRVSDSGELELERRSVISLWPDVAVPGAPWPMWGGSPLRNGAWPADTEAPPAGGASGTGIVAGSHICYPNPLTRGPLQVRARLRMAGRVRAHVYNLEGELVASSAWRDVPGQSAFDVSVDLSRAVPGMYVCRLEAVTGGAAESSVVAFAVSR